MMGIFHGLWRWGSRRGITLFYLVANDSVVKAVLETARSIILFVTVLYEESADFHLICEEEIAGENGERMRIK